MAEEPTLSSTPVPIGFSGHGQAAIKESSGDDETDNVSCHQLSIPLPPKTLGSGSTFALMEMSSSLFAMSVAVQLARAAFLNSALFQALSKMNTPSGVSGAPKKGLFFM